jgi:hypothetical protein
MGEWHPLEDGIIKLMIEICRTPESEYEQEFYYTMEGNEKYLEYMDDKNICFGKLVEFYHDGSKISRCSFCNGRSH